MMTPEQYWKNFSLGCELQVAGRFLYNGLHTFHDMHLLEFEDEVFDVLYNLSVGMERLLKTAVVLIEHDPSGDQKKFEKSLKTHDHLILRDRVVPSDRLNLADVHNDFLQLLASFYRSQRYGRYALKEVHDETDEKKDLQLFFERHLTISFPGGGPIDPVRNHATLKKFLGEVVGEIATQVYRVIRDEADRLRIYTCDLRSDSKAAVLFFARRFDFLEEDAFVKEILLHLMNSTEASGQLGWMKRQVPLEFDSGLVAEHIECLLSYEKRSAVMDDLESLYESEEEQKTRMAVLESIGDHHFDPGEDEDPDDDHSIDGPS